jgi:hypothetical protein
MSFVAKTVLIFQNAVDVRKASTSYDWESYLTTLGGTDHTDLSVLDETTLTVTRFWNDKSRAIAYKDWILQRFQELSITPVSFTVEDITV